jgi:hypothetical protein
MCRLQLAIFSILLLISRCHAETSTVCKCDGKKCGEVQILSSLVPLAVKFAGLTQGSCSSQGYTERTGEVLKVKTPIGTIESPVYVKAVGEVKKRLDRVRRKIGNPFSDNKYTNKIRSKAKFVKQRPLREASRLSDGVCGASPRSTRRPPVVRRTKTTFTYTF